MTTLPYICNCITWFVCNCLKALTSQVVVQAPSSGTTSFNLSSWGPWIRDPQHEGQENMLPQQFRDDAPQQQEVVMEQKTMPLSLGNIILLKEKRGMRESISR